MNRTYSTELRNLWKVVAGLLILKTVITVILSYRDYVPPNFGSPFLYGRESYFWGGYRLRSILRFLANRVVMQSLTG